MNKLLDVRCGYDGTPVYLVFRFKLHIYADYSRESRIFLGSFSLSWEQRKFEETFVERRERTETENEDTLLSCEINGMFLNSELFGHFRGTTTANIYAHLDYSAKISSAQAMESGLSLPASGGFESRWNTNNSGEK